MLQGSTYFVGTTPLLEFKEIHYAMLTFLDRMLLISFPNPACPLFLPYSRHSLAHVCAMMLVPGLLPREVHQKAISAVHFQFGCLTSALKFLQLLASFRDASQE